MQAIVLREIVRAYPGYTSVALLASALNYPDEAWLPYTCKKSSRAPIAHHRVHRTIQVIREKFGKDIIEADKGAAPGRASLGYRLTRRGRELLGGGGDAW